MLRLQGCFLLILFIITNVFPQGTELPHQYLTAETINLEFPINSIDVRAIGMGNAQIANGKTFNAMMYNPALLGHARNSIEFLGIQAGMPPDTYDAANYLSNHIDEFEEAISLNQIWDGLDMLAQPGASNQQKLEALNEIQDGMVFINELVLEVTGSSDAPKVHGINLLPGISAQFGNFGFSLYGFGHAGFVGHLSPTFESLLEIEIPTTLDNPVARARAIVQLTAALAPAIIGPREFSDNVYPTTYYNSYFDIVGAAGYGFPVNENLTIGANLKIINRRFSVDRIDVAEYDEIISTAWDRLKSNVTGVTCDLGAHYQFKQGTSVGATFQNIIPVKEISKSIDTEFNFNRIIKSDISGDGQIDSLQYVTWEATVTRPFALNVPFIMSVGVCHPLTHNWDIAVDWVDIAENDSRYEETLDRIRLGTEYRYSALKNSLTITPRFGLSEQRIALGLGFNILKYIHLDGAYAYDTFVNENAFYAQLKVGW